MIFVDAEFYCPYAQQVNCCRYNIGTVT